jgi:hypothetical protein
VEASLTFSVQYLAVRIEQCEPAIVAEAAARCELRRLDVDTVERLDREDAQPRDVRFYDATTSASPRAMLPPCTTSAYTPTWEA